MVSVITVELSKLEQRQEIDHSLDKILVHASSF